jgi:16S rRNA (guanine(966)-N(2))-methyltransferase RsmD
MSIRITGGQLSGRKLTVGSGHDIRPTPDRVRLALFNSLMAHRRVAGGRVLDLCAGSGALGIEALSRDAESVDFIDRDTKILSQNIDQLKLNDRAKIHRCDIRRLPEIGGGFDLIFFDPPYQSGLYQPVMEHIIDKDLLRPTGWLILETDKQMDLDIPAGLNQIDMRQYGRTVIHILELA